VDTVLVKIGGKAAEREEDLAALCDEMRAMEAAHRFVLVHGGGAEVSATSRRLGIEPVIRDGVRQTTAEEMDIVDMVLRGKVNSSLVRLLGIRGIAAVGLGGSDGGTFTGEPVSAGTRTGEVRRIDERLLSLLLANGYLPVLCSTSMDGDGRGLNINADAVAFSLAAHLGASALVFLSDIAGIMSQDSVVQSLTPAEARELISSGVISGGMLPKVSASLEAIERGVGKVIIGQYEGAGSLARLIEGRQGTRLWQ
jgi:acetylglutamate kinase